MDTNDKAISVIYDLHREIKILDETVGSLEGMRNRAFKDLEIEKEKMRALQERADNAFDQLKYFKDRESVERSKVNRLHNAIEGLLKVHPSIRDPGSYEEILEAGIPEFIGGLITENGKLAAQKSELEDLICSIKAEIQDPNTSWEVTCCRIATLTETFEDKKKDQNNG